MHVLTGCSDAPTRAVVCNKMCSSGVTGAVPHQMRGLPSQKKEVVVTVLKDASRETEETGETVVWNTGNGSRDHVQHLEGALCVIFLILGNG